MGFHVSLHAGIASKQGFYFMIPGSPGYIKGQNLKIGVERDALAEVGPGAQGQIGPVKDGGAGAGPEFGVFKSQRYGAFLKTRPKNCKICYLKLAIGIERTQGGKIPPGISVCRFFAVFKLREINFVRLEVKIEGRSLFRVINAQFSGN